MKRKVSIQKGFVFGVTAVAIVAVLTGVVTRMSNISADTTSIPSAATNCVTGSQMVASPLTDYEKTNFGAKANAFQVMTLQKKTFRFVIGATQQSSIGAGGVVNLKVGIGNLNNYVYTEKKGRMVVVLPDGTKIDYYYDSPNLAVGAYWSATKPVSLTSYSSVIRLENRNGSGYYLQGCVSNPINFVEALASPVPSVVPSKSPSKTPVPSPSKSPSVTSSQVVSDGGFESGVDGWVGHNATVTQVGGAFHSGTHSLRVATTADNGGARKSFTTVVGTKYQVTAWLNGVNTNTRVWVGTTAGGGDLLRLLPEIKAGWVKVSNTFTATGTTTYVEYRPASTTSGTGEMDDFSFAKAVTASPTPSKTPSVTASVSAAPAISLVPAASIDQKTLTQGTKIIFYNDTKLEDGVLARKDSDIAYNWGNQPPSTGLKANNWSSLMGAYVMAPKTGDYSIGVNYNDGVRIWLGGKKIVDDWTDWVACPNGPAATCDNANMVKKRAAKVHMEQGKVYPLRVEYYDVSNRAILKMFWKIPGGTTGDIIPKTAFFTTYNPNPAHGTGTGLLGMYYSGSDFNNYVFYRKDATVNFDWKLDAPRKDMAVDNFSAKWNGKIRPRFSEEYTFSVTAKDGVKVWVNNEVVIDQYHDVLQPTTWTGKISLGAGKVYPIQIEYYNSQGAASMSLKWKSPSEKLAVVPYTDLYFPGAPVTSVVPSVTPSKSPSKTPSPTCTAVGGACTTEYAPVCGVDHRTYSNACEATKVCVAIASQGVCPSISPSPSPSPSKTPPVLKITVKPGWNAISVPSTSSPVLARPMTIDPYNFLTFAFNTSALDTDTNSPTYNKIVRKWNQSPSIFNKRMGYYLKNNSSKDVIATFQNSTSANSAVIYKGWNLLANSSAKAMTLAEMTYTKKTCTDGAADPINCTGYFGSVPFSGVSFGKAGEGKAAFTKVYYVAKPNANSETPDPFTVYNVADLGGPSKVSIPAGGVFWLYFFD